MQSHLKLYYLRQIADSLWMRRVRWRTISQTKKFEQLQQNLFPFVTSWHSLQQSTMGTGICLCFGRFWIKPGVKQAKKKPLNAITLPPGHYVFHCKSFQQRRCMGRRSLVLLFPRGGAHGGSRIAVVLPISSLLYSMIRWKSIKNSPIKQRRSEKEKNSVSQKCGKNNELQQQAAELEMQALHYSSHFIFNSLNSINGSFFKTKTKASRIFDQVLRLSKTDITKFAGCINTTTMKWTGSIEIVS